INKPFVWGPIGGMEITKWNFLPTMGVYGFFYFMSRNIVNLFQLNFNKRPRQAASREKSALIAATPDTATAIKKYFKRNSTVISEVGTYQNAIPGKNTREENQPLRIVWSGLHSPGKSLNILLHSLKNLPVNYHLHVLGEGPETGKWKKLAKKFKLDQRITWHGWLPRTESLNIMASGH